MVEQRGDVDVTMLRRVGAESPLSLLELALAADAVAAAGLVPRDRDVDEPLVEVPLLRRRRAPRRLELLVRGEELAAPDQLETLTQMRCRNWFLAVRPVGSDGHTGKAHAT